MTEHKPYTFDEINKLRGVCPLSETLELIDGEEIVCDDYCARVDVVKNQRLSYPFFVRANVNIYNPKNLVETASKEVEIQGLYHLEEIIRNLIKIQKSLR